MNQVVLDASVIAPFLIPDEADRQSQQVFAILVEGRGVVPQHWRLEVANLGRKAVRRNRITRAELEEAIALFACFAVAVDDSTDAIAWSTILQMASEHDLTSYDAAYLELANRTGLPLATEDRALAAAAAGRGVKLLQL